MKSSDASDKAPYRKVEVALWSDDRFMAFSRPQPNAQTLWLYFLTGPRTTPLPGLVCAREAVMADDLGWDLNAFRIAYREVNQVGLVVADWDAGVVVLQKALFDGSGKPRNTTKPTSPKHLIGWARWFKLVRECPLKYEYLRQLETLAIALGKAFEIAYRDAYADEIRKATALATRFQYTENREQKNSCEPPAEASHPALLSLVPPNGPGARKPRSAEQATGPHRTVTDAYFAHFEVAYGTKPIWSAKQGGQLNRLLKTHTASEIVRRLEILFTAPPAWLDPPHDFGTLVSNFDRLVQPSTAKGSDAPRVMEEL